MSEHSNYPIGQNVTQTGMVVLPVSVPFSGAPHTKWSDKMVHMLLPTTFFFILRSIRLFARSISIALQSAFNFICCGELIYSRAKCGFRHSVLRCPQRARLYSGGRVLSLATWGFFGPKIDQVTRLGSRRPEYIHKTWQTPDSAEVFRDLRIWVEGFLPSGGVGADWGLGMVGDVRPGLSFGW
jgi:hypothetical protein